MNLYNSLRPLLFKIDPEYAHRASLSALNLAHQTGLLRRLAPKVPPQPLRVMGLDFANPVGLAAGLDKNGDHIDALAALGFGFIEIGTVTPRPQPGNPKPRLFRLPQAEAIINRMGFNNKGIDHLVARVRQSKYRGILGINLGKNFDTPIENAVDDYLIGLKKAYPYAGYITINISSPNTANLRRLQQGDEIKKLISALKEAQIQLKAEHGRHVPLVIKIAPDLNEAEIEHIGSLLLEFEVDGVIATNTTISRDAVAGLPGAEETGGLSGAPLTGPSTAVVKAFANTLGGKIPIIAAGGIMSGENAVSKIDAGASLVQLYSGLIYRGPALIREVAEALSRKMA
ncbi:MAG: quinone-dependent dihydroorotate dehydrogenase [Pseudomonadota bacterium]